LLQFITYVAREPEEKDHVQYRYRWKDNINMDLKEIGNIFGLDSYQKLGASEHGNLPVCSIKGWEFCDHMSDYTHLRTCYLYAETDMTAPYKEKIQFLDSSVLTIHVN
jgi:hypothetical protein